MSLDATSWGPALAAQGLSLLWADAHFCAIAKPCGLLVHRSGLDAQATDSVVDRLRQALPDAVALGLAPVHRLDKATSGLLLLARHAEAARAMGAQFEAGAVSKHYLALLRGWPEPDTWVDYPLARDPELPSQGQAHLPAQTRFVRLARVEWPFSVDGRHASSRYALVRAEPQQGRRHHIRRHAKAISHPLVGDSTHGKARHNHAVAEHVGLSRLWLHARTLCFRHPFTGQTCQLHAPPGPDWQQLLQCGPWLDPIETL